MATFPYTVINDLPELQMIAGADRVLTFNIYTSGSIAPNLAGASFTWKLSPYGQYSSVLTKSGSWSGSSLKNQFTVSLEPSDTNILSGIYLQQYTLVSASGYTYIPSQGIIRILQLIS